MCRRHVNLLCLNIPGILMSLGQPSTRRKAAQLVQVIIQFISCPTALCSNPLLVNLSDFLSTAEWHAKL